MQIRLLPFYFLVFLVTGVALLTSHHAKAMSPVIELCSDRAFSYKLVDHNKDRILIYGNVATGAKRFEAKLIQSRPIKQEKEFLILYQLSPVAVDGRPTHDHHAGIMEHFFVPAAVKKILIEIYDENEALFQTVTCHYQNPYKDKNLP